MTTLNSAIVVRGLHELNKLSNSTKNDAESNFYPSEKIGSGRVNPATIRVSTPRRCVTVRR